MKNYTFIAFIATILLFVCSSSDLGATLPEGSTADDFTLTDINGNSHNLYNYLNQGYSVVIDMSATWCGPCWSFHQSGTLEDIWDDYGPDGDDMMMVMIIEVDANTNQDCFFGPTGCNNSTYGDWSAGVDYLAFNPPSSEASAINNDYQITLFPTMYVISPTGWVKPFIGSGTTYEQIESWGANSFQMHNSTWEVIGDGCSDGSIDLTPFQGEGNISFEWSNGATTEDLNNVPSDTYYVTLTDANGYEAELGPIEVEGNPAMVISTVSQVEVDCYSNNTGHIEIDGSGGVGDFSYNWSNGESGTVLSNLYEGDYELTVTDEDTGCEVFESYYISEPDEIEIEYDITDATCDNNIGEIEFEMDGGVYPFTYTINGITYYTDDIELPAGTYFAEIEDTNGCMESTTFTISQPPTPVVQVVSTGSITCSNTSTELNSTGSTTGSNISYFWYDQTGASLGSTSSITVSNPGIYTLSVFDNDTDCESSMDLEVVSNSNPPAAISNAANQITCSTPTVLISGAGSASGGNISYSWTGAGIVGSNTSQDITVNLGGTYTLMVTDTSNGCSSTTSVDIAQAAIPNIVSPTNTTFCAGSSTQLCVPVAANETIEWLLNGTVVSTNSCLQSNAANNYTVNLTDTNTGCTVSQSLVTNTMALPTATVSGNTSFCAGGSTELCHEVQDGSNYNWNYNGQTATSRCITVNTATMVQLVATSSQGCTNTRTLTVVQNTGPTASIATPNMINCSVDQALLDLTVSNPNATIAWYGPAGTLISTDTDINVSETGTYTAYITDNNGCETQASTTVNSDTSVPQISIAAPEQLDCSTNEVTIDLTTNGVYQIQWMDTNGNIISTSEDLSVTNAGTYTAIAVNAAGCQTESSVTVTADTSLPQLNLDTPAQLTCSTTSVALNLSTNGSYQLTWYDPAGNILSNEEDIIVSQAGTYLVTALNNQGCLTESSVTVLENLSAPQVSIAQPSALDCNNDASTMSADLSNASQFTWYDATGLILSTGANISNNTSQTVTQPGIYTLEVTSDGGCITTTDITVTQIDNSTVTPVFISQSDEFNFQFTDQTALSGNVSYSWDFGDGSTSTEANPAHIYNDPGFYTVCLATTNECGTTSTCQEILASAALTASIEITDISCYGMSDGTISLDVQGGLEGYTFDWVDSSLFGDEIINVSSGTYTVVITDQAGQQITEEVVIIEPSELIVSATVGNTPMGESSAEISLDITGGTPDYNVLWSNGETNETISGLSQGEYTASITDANGCESIQTYTVTGSVFVSDLSDLVNLSISPNPTTDFIDIKATFDSTKAFEISIISMIGERQLLSSRNTKTLLERVDLSTFTSGIYFIELRSQGQVAIEKIIISK